MLKQFKETEERIRKAGFPPESHKHDDRNESEKLFDKIHASFKKEKS